MRCTLIPLIACVAVLPMAAASAATPDCTEPHYRWREKTTLSLLAHTPVHATIGAMLGSWGVPAIYGSADECKARTGRELKNYSVTGWIRRRLAEDDGDWHIELTSARTGAVADSCIVVEIPSGSEGGQFQVARDQFTALVTAAGATIKSNFHANACARCHGPTAHGAQNGPPLVKGDSAKWLHSNGSYDGIIRTITAGVPKDSLVDKTRRFQMNPRGSSPPISDDAVKAVAAYIWKLNHP